MEEEEQGGVEGVVHRHPPLGQQLPFIQHKPDNGTEHPRGEQTVADIPQRLSLFWRQALSSGTTVIPTRGILDHPEEDVSCQLHHDREIDRMSEKHAAPLRVCQHGDRVTCQQSR